MVREISPELSTLELLKYPACFQSMYILDFLESAKLKMSACADESTYSLTL